MQLLVDYLVHRGIYHDRQAECVGYSGRYGTRDMEFVIDGRSRVAPRPKAFAMLCKKYNVTDEHLLEHTRRKAAKPPVKIGANRLRMLIDYLDKYHNVDLRLASQWLGYSGNDPDRDIGIVLSGRSRRVSIKDAYIILSEQYHVADYQLDNYATEWMARRAKLDPPM